jgi:hypothetical protein
MWPLCVGKGIEMGHTVCQLSVTDTLLVGESSAVVCLVMRLLDVFVSWFGVG